MKALTAHIQTSEGRRCLRSSVNRARSSYIFLRSGVIRGPGVFVWRDAATRLRGGGARNGPGSENAPGDLLNRREEGKKRKGLFARLQFSAAEIPGEPVTQVQEGTRGWVVRGCNSSFCWRGRWLTSHYRHLLQGGNRYFNIN